MLNLNDRHVMRCTDVDDQQLPSMKKLLKGSRKKLVTNDRRLIDCSIAESVGISTGSIHSILTENLLIKKVSARWMPWMLSDIHGQIELTCRQVYSACLTKIPMALFHDF